MQNSLCNKTFYFLGSSVTYGEPDGVSFVDYIAERNGCICIKQAVSGTTLADVNDRSYVRRFAAHAPTVSRPDHFICQLSTNDAGQGLPLGKISGGYTEDSFDTKTVIGAIEWIICRALTLWQCPVSFYTNTRYDEPKYAAMVDALFELQKKWSFGIIDLWNKSGMSNSVDAVRERYMNDFIHPNESGYKDWWTPIFEAHLKQYH